LIALRDCTLQPQAVSCWSMFSRARDSGVGMDTVYFTHLGSDDLDR
jgi:hypothetical protein